MRAKYYQGITAEKLREILEYHPTSGYWYWIKAPYYRIKKGTRTARPNRQGRCLICINGVQYQATRLAWLYMTGEWPLVDIDHKDHNPANCRWKNLRLATFSQNRANSKLNANSTTGYKGVYKNYNKYMAVCRRKYLGSFASAKEASRAYLKEAKKQFGEFARAR